jgi:alcohol dehydrogenase class IV
MASSFQIPATVLFGAGASGELPALVKRLGARRVLLVTDPFFAGNGLADRFARSLEQAGIQVAIYSEVQPNPTDQNAAAGLSRLQDSEAELVVAIGGGSSIDAGKAIAVLATNPGPLSEYAGYHRIPRPGLPLIAIPTTAGTGSEVSRVTVITDTGRDVKLMILDSHLLAAAAIVDYELTLSMPAALTAHVGVDTLTHGIEAYVSRKANGLSDPLALSCIRLTARHLAVAWSQPDHREAREGMALAACHGGMAFSNSSVCLVHGMSRPIGALFHLPHGLSNAVLLPTVTRYSLAGAVARYAEVARAMGYAGPEDADETAASALAEGLVSLNERLEVPRLRDCPGITLERFEQTLEKMAGDALASGSPQNNPVVPTAGEIMELYRQAW